VAEAAKAAPVLVLWLVLVLVLLPLSLHLLVNRCTLKRKRSPQRWEPSRPPAAAAGAYTRPLFCSP